MTPRQHAVAAINQFSDVRRGELRDNRWVELPRGNAIEVVKKIIEEALEEQKATK